jgi:hypothetical protein
MNEQREELIGEISVGARLYIGSERLRLLVTGKRLILAHVGKRGAGVLATTSFFGRLGAAVEDLFKSGKESIDKRRAAGLTPQEILDAEKDNFAISYDDIVYVEILEKTPVTGITILTREDKFNLSTTTEFEKVLELLQDNLGAKLTVKRAEASASLNRK